MVESEERPSKIRKIDTGFEKDEVAAYVDEAEDGSLERGIDEAATSTENDGGKALPSDSKEAEDIRLSVNGSEDAVETKPSEPLSKNQIKKLLKKQLWEEGREYRKAKRREKGKEKKIRKAEARATADPQSVGDAIPQPEVPKKSTQRSIQLPITFVLDCDFDNLMTEAELISLGSQLTRCYSDNKSAPYRAHLVVSSFSGALKHRFETVLASNHLGWKGVRFTAEDFFAAASESDAIMRGQYGGQLVGAFAGVAIDVPLQPPFPPQETTKSHSSPIATSEFTKTSNAGKSVTFGTASSSTEHGDAVTCTSRENKSTYTQQPAAPELNSDINTKALKSSPEPAFVYLTSDSPHTLDVLSPYTTYIIGGIVDKNRHKGICYKRAMARNVPTAKLPIGDYMTMQSRSVLATNHVAEIMLRWLEYGDWAKAFLEVIPKRKEARLRVQKGEADNSQNKTDDRASSSSKGDSTFSTAEEL